MLSTVRGSSCSRLGGVLRAGVGGVEEMEDDEDPCCCCEGDGKFSIESSVWLSGLFEVSNYSKLNCQ